MNYTETFFKYLDIDGAEKVLSDGTLMFTSPTEFNDPFDISIQSLAPFDIVADRLTFSDLLIEAVLAPELPSGNGDELYNKIRMIHESLKKASNERRMEFRKMPRRDVWNETNLKRSYDRTFRMIKAVHEAEGVFCASKKFNNHLLWAHYADKHRGAVLAFKPDIEKDSVLSLITEVEYSSNRPYLYESQEDYFNKSIFKDKLTVLNEYSKKITTTKSLDWAYEEEVRICIPLLINHFVGEKRKTQKYYDNELVEIYLGCKMSDIDKNRIIELSLNRNSEVKVFQMVQSQFDFKLESREVRV